MSIVQLIDDLNYVRSKLKQFLVGRYGDIFDQIGGRLRNCVGKESWSFHIDKDEPLKFREDETGQRIEADLFGDLEGDRQRTEMTVQSLTVRMRSTIEESTSVVLRFRFDREDDDTDGFPYHIQIGGHNRSEDENCPIPPSLDIPRFPFWPMDLFLVCEFILANLYPNSWNKLRADRKWKAIACRAQQGMNNYLKTTGLCSCANCPIPTGSGCSEQKPFLSRLWREKNANQAA